MREGGKLSEGVRGKVRDGGRMREREMEGERNRQSERGGGDG